MKPHVPAFRIPNTTAAEAERREGRADEVEADPPSGGTSAMRRVRTRIITTISTSPANTYRQDAYVVKSPPMSGPAATAIAPAAATSP